MRNRRVAFVYDAIYPYITGGAEKRYFEIGKRLVGQGFDVHLYGMKLWDGPNIIESDGMTLHGIMKARPLYTSSGRRSISQALLFGLACIKLVNQDFDVIDCCGFPYFSIFSCKLVAKLKKKPLFVTWHEVWGREYWNQYLRTAGFIGYCVEWLASRMPEYIISISQHTTDQLKAHLGIESKLIVANGVDTNFIKSILPAELNTDLIYVGRLMNFKNINLIIESLALLKERGDILTCAIIGTGPENDTLVNLALRLGVESQLKWLGKVEGSHTVYSHIKSSKIFVLPSSREGFGIVAIEANACGKPVLAANFAQNAAKDLIQPGINGYLFEPTASALSTAIKKLLIEAESLEDSTMNFVNTYDWDNLVGNLVGVYAQ